MDYTMDSLLAYDPDEERRKKYQADSEKAANLGKEQTQGSRKPYDPNYDPILDERRARGRQDIQSAALDPTSPMNLFGIRDAFSPTAKGAMEARQQRANDLSRSPSGGPVSMSGIATPQPTMVGRAVDPNSPNFTAQARKSYDSAKQAQADAMWNQYKDKMEPAIGGLAGQQVGENIQPAKNPLMFSMGGGPLKAYDPNGPDIGAPGKGGLSMQPLDNNSSFEDWRSKVANPGMFEGAMEALEMPGIQAGLSRDRALAEDPFLRENVMSRQRMAEKMAPEQAKQEGIQDYYGHAMELRQGRKAELDKLHKSPTWTRLDPQKQAAAEADLNSFFDDQEDALDFAYHGRTRRKQGLGL